jgi:prepilin-type N-terminal cleavage/methylation domain-containing protein
MTRIKSALERRMAGIKENDKGFSLIELLVVVIIIGILAAIAIPIYIGVQNSAKDSAVQADLANAKTAVVAYYTNEGSYPAAINSATLSDYGYSSSSVTDGSSGTASITAFCLTATSGSGTVFYITQDSSATSTKPASGCA